MKLNLGKWEQVSRKPFAAKDVPAIAGISGGRTSGMMAALLDPRVVLAFENTGLEHPKTYEFIVRLEDALEREIVWLEWRPPPRRGDPPRMFGFERVSFATASRKGEPFREMLNAVRDYRKENGEGPISPWARSRICTAYLKYMVQRHFCDSIGWETYDQFVGLRADEQDRVTRLHSRATRKRDLRCPLAYVGIVKKDVLEFFSQQEFDLEIDEHQGNCTACFLKDESDLAMVLGESETLADWWIGVGNEFPDFGGRRFVGYEQLSKETRLRELIRSGLRDQSELAKEKIGQEALEKGIDERRVRLVVLQEKRRMAGDRTSFSCACESQMPMDDE